MLALLKPWRDLRALKEEDDEWEIAYDRFMRNAKQRDKDVVAGCQYYYESKDVAVNRLFDEEREENTEGYEPENDEFDTGDVREEVDASDVTVSFQQVTVTR